MRTRGQHQEGLPLLHASHHYGKTQEQFVSLADSSETMWWFLSSLGDTDFACGTHFCRIKLIPGFVCIIKAIIKTMRCSKPFHQALKTQSCLSPAFQRKPSWEPLQQPSILLGRGPRSLSSYKVYSTASAQVEEQGKSLLKMLRAAIT